jgi:hypothetical protein
VTRSDASEALAAPLAVALAGTDSWYVRDRAGIALAYVLLPESRAAWEAATLGRVHRPGLVLGHVLLAARRGDLSVVGALEWPASGVVQAHLPLRWVVELAVAARAAGNPAPIELVDDLGAHLRPALEAVAA